MGGAFYPVPLALLGQRVRVRWDAHLVRVFDGDTLIMVHARVAAGVFAPRAGEGEASSRQQAFVDRLVGQCERVGPAVKQWAAAALAARGVRAIRLIQGVLALTRRHPRERILAAVTEAHTHQHFRYQTIRQLVTPDHLRGRMTAANMIFFMGGPQLGELEAGVVANVIGPPRVGAPWSVIIGGVGCLLSVGWVTAR